MKKSLFLFLVLLCSSIAFAQSRAILLNETFDSESLPEGWTTSENGAENWLVSATNNAGGDANELSLAWWPMLTGTSRIITRTIDLSEINEVVVSFRHFLDNQINSYTLGIATSSDNGNTWNTAWSDSYETSGQYEVYQLISTSDMGKDNVLFSLFYEGTSYTMNGWYFDNLQISTQDNMDLSVVSIDVPEVMPYGMHEISFSVQNMGSSTIETFEAQFIDFYNDERVITQTFETNIQSLAVEQFVFSEEIYLAPGTYNMPVEIISVNGEDVDADSTNDKIEKYINVSIGSAQKIPMIEHFSSSTCGPCVDANAMMLEITNANPGKYTYTKYPVNWPGMGDPYYINEVGARVYYYQVGSAPQLYLDGLLQEYTIVTQEVLDASFNTPSYADIRGAFVVDGNTINITADFMSYIKMDNVKAFVTINEKVTTGNASSNGETEFRHILMKMLDSPLGNEIDIETGEYQRMEFSFDMSSTNVEDMNDIEVALWLQNEETKEIYNSHYAYEYTEHCYPVRNMTARWTYEKSDNEYSLLVEWETPEHGTPMAYNIYIDGTLVADNVSGLSYCDETAYDDDAKVVEVVAVYENGKTSVGAVRLIDDSVELKETENITLSVYPNPAKDYVKVSIVNNEQSTVRIYNMVGMMIDEIEMTTDNIEINISDYNPGIYFFNIEGEVVKVVKR